MRTRRTLLAVVAVVAAFCSSNAGAQNPPVTPGDPRSVYIVVLNHGKGAEPDFAQGGAKQLARWSDRIVVELPPAALAALQKHGRVKYIQHLTAGGSSASASDVTASEHHATTSVAARPMSGGALTWNTGEYHYDGSGNIDKIGSDDAGNTRRFKYDELNRLVEAGLEAPGAPPGTYTNYSRYTYDSFGNRLSETTPSVSSTLTANPATNHVSMAGTTISYDGVGNMTQGGGFWYQFDPFNNVKEIDGGSVQKMSIYNANDERIILCGDGSAGNCHWTLRGVQNEVLREYESGPITGSFSYYTYYLWSEDYVYRGAQIAGAQREDAEGGRLFFHLDHLGSPRLITNSDGQQIERNEFAPFGRELASVMQESQLGYSAETRRFTGHERDFAEGVWETANFVDYMHARTYSPVLGRFLTADPAFQDSRWDLTEPQSFNLYSYVGNNPMTRVDGDGRCWPFCAGVQVAHYLSDHPTLAFAVNHPWIAREVGKPIAHIHSTNMSTNAVRLSTGLGLYETPSHTGSPVNAVRHVVWEAAIAAKYGTGIAKEVGDAHETNPAADLSVRKYSGKGAADAADQTVDLLNNQIGRAIGAAHPNASMSELTGFALDYYHTNGLYTESVKKDGSIEIRQSKLTDAEYAEAMRRLLKVDDYGFIR